MNDNIITALEALEHEFNTVTGVRAEFVDNALVIHVTMQEAFHNKSWRIEWSINSEYFDATSELTYDGDYYAYINDEIETVTPQEAERILNETSEEVEAPPIITSKQPIDPDTHRMLEFAANLDYLTRMGKSTLLPVRLVWEL